MGGGAGSPIITSEKLPAPRAPGAWGSNSPNNSLGGPRGVPSSGWGGGNLVAPVSRPSAAEGGRWNDTISSIHSMGVGDDVQAFDGGAGDRDRPSVSSRLGDPSRAAYGTTSRQQVAAYDPDDEVSDTEYA